MDKSFVDSQRKYLSAEIRPKHKGKGTVSMAIAGTSTGSTQDMNGVLGSNTTEGMDVQEKINSAFTDSNFRSFKDIRIKHTIVLDDPFPDPDGLVVPDVSPLPTQAMLDTVRIPDDEELESQLAPEEEEKIRRQKKLKH
ncbi:Peptidyl-prolyl cis-trans isomerase cyp6 [Mortierella sp. AM989]|nr:Peptidyl-prolyl cis-trans isomerase cyp6 [Mortierella sp. AM989]